MTSTAEIATLPGRDAQPEAAEADGASMALLFAALVQAQGEVQSVTHDARNSQFDYPYTSAEAIIREARRALNTAGLGVSRLRKRIVTHEYEQTSANGGQVVVYRAEFDWLLYHTSGASLPLSTTDPVLVSRGRPEDKGELAAETSALSYLLRDLLLMDRPDPLADINQRDDEGYEPRQQQRRSSSSRRRLERGSGSAPKSTPKASGGDGERTLAEKVKAGFDACAKLDLSDELKAKVREANKRRNDKDLAGALRILTRVARQAKFGAGENTPQDAAKSQDGSDEATDGQAETTDGSAEESQQVDATDGGDEVGGSTDGAADPAELRIEVLRLSIQAKKSKRAELRKLGDSIKPEDLLECSPRTLATLRDKLRSGLAEAAS